MRSVCFLLAALLLVLTIGVQIRLRAVEHEIRALESERAELEKESGIVSARLAGRMSLGELERRAAELGMRRPRADQIVEIGIEEDGAE